MQYPNIMRTKGTLVTHFLPAIHVAFLLVNTGPLTFGQESPVESGDNWAVSIYLSIDIYFPVSRATMSTCLNASVISSPVALNFACATLNSGRQNATVAPIVARALTHKRTDCEGSRDRAGIFSSNPNV